MATGPGTERNDDSTTGRLERIDVDVTSEAVFWIGSDARFLDVNVAACRSLGYTREALLTQGIADIDPDFTTEKWLHHLAALRQQGSARFESTHRARDGRLFPVEVLCNHVQIGSDERACAFVRDISERKRAEALSAMEHWVTRSLAEASSSREVLKSVQRIICEHEHWESSGYFQREDDAGTSRLIVGWSGPTARQKIRDYYSSAINTVIPAGGIISRVLAEGKPVWIPHVLASHTTWRERIEKTGQRTTFAFPVFVDGKTIGVLAFADAAIRKPDEALLQAVNAIGAQVGQFIQRKQAEEALRNNEMHLQCILQSTADGILAVDLQGHVILTNRRFAELWQIPQSILDSKDDRTLMDFAVGQLTEPDAFMARVRALYQSDAECVDTVSFKDGRIFERFTFPMRSNREIVGRVWSFRDITARKKAEIALHQSEETLRATFGQAGVGIAVIGLTSQYLQVNDKYCELLGHTREALLQMTRDTIAPAWLAELSLQRTFPADGALTNLSIERQLERKDGRLVWVQSAVTLARGPHGEPTHFIVVFEDVSARKRAEMEHSAVEAQLRETQKMQAIGTLVGGIAHDFNNILSTILGHTEMAQLDSASLPGIQESLQEIHKAGSRARDLVQQMLTFSQRQRVARQPMDLALVVTEAARLLQATLPAQLILRVDCAAGVPAVMADAGEIRRAIANLVANASQAMGACRGTIRIRLDAVNLDAALVAERPALQMLHEAHPGRTARLAVTDDGPGMDMATRERIFEPFFTTKPVNAGTGLGLSVVHGIVQRHEGAIVVESQPGRGATFSLYFPAAAPSETARASNDRSTVTAGPEPGLRVLFVDDDPMPLLLFKRYFERRGCQVTDCTNPGAALETLRADPTAFDLVITDYKMPDLSGLDLAREVRVIAPQLPVAVLSGFIDDTLQAQSHQAGVRALLSKSDPIETIYQAIRGIVAPTAASLR